MIARSWFNIICPLIRYFQFYFSQILIFSFLFQQINIVEAVVLVALSTLTTVIGCPAGIENIFDRICTKLAVSWAEKQFGLHNMTPDHIRRIRSYVGPDNTDVQQSLLDIFFGISALSEFVGGAGNPRFSLTIDQLFDVIDELEKIALDVWNDAAKRSIQNVSERRTSIRDPE